MTEVYQGDAPPSEPKSVEYDSTILFNASANLERAFESILDDDGLAYVATRGLVLATRSMRFPNFAKLQQFQGNVVDRTILRSSRLDLRPAVEWETAVSPKGVELNRIFFLPEPADATALRGLYHSYVDRHPGPRPYNGNDPHQRLQSGSLNYTIPSSMLRVSAQDGVQLLNQRLRSEAPNNSHVLYASNPRPYNKRVEKRPERS